MVHPTILAIVSGILAIAALAAVDWYVWRAVSGWASYRQPIVKPLSMRELAATSWRGTMMNNREVTTVPPSMAEATNAKVRVIVRKEERRFDEVA
ncbi:MAG TPA: hypothetical protein VMF50_11780 [Candidatus Binataceae bacterium]|nr:hypothetical protein [Candidatus Binataceae bacterium]